jgi:hypothetical protein
MITDLQKRREQLDDVIRICGLDTDEHRVLRGQLESFSVLAVDVTHQLILRADNGQATYWLERCESAERFIAGEMAEIS